MAEIRYQVDDKELKAETFLTHVNNVWPGEYDLEMTEAALKKTLNITAWDGEILIGSARLLTDGYFFSTVPEILVNPAYQKQGIGKRLMELIYEASPTTVFLGAQAGNEPFFEEKLGYTYAMRAYIKKKPRPRREVCDAKEPAL
jgi:GNAT superfamily N-acetyltransferase